VRPIYYYHFNFPLSFSPWIFFLPSAFVYAYSRENGERRKEILFLTLWIGVVFIFFSLSKGKRSLYLLPLFPAASLLVGKLLHDFISSQVDHFRQEWVSIPIYGLLGGLMVSGVALPWIVSMKFHSYLADSLPLIFLLVGGSIAMFVSYRLKSHGALFLLLIGLLGAGYFYTGRTIFPFLNHEKSTKSLAHEITSRIHSGEKLAVYRRVSAAHYNFYTGIVPILELKNPSGLVQFLNSSERVFCLITLDELRQFQKLEGTPEVHLIAQHPIGGNGEVLISNHLDKGAKP
jgi:hypothetical protein